jgi:FecR protein
MNRVAIRVRQMRRQAATFRPVKKSVFLSLCAGAAALAVNRSAAEPFTSATVTRLENKVAVGEVRSGGVTKERPAAVADVVKERDYLHTQAQSRAELQFPDSSLVRVGQNTVFSFDADSRTLSLQKGAMLFYVPPGTGGKIKTPSLTAAITGTIGKVSENLIAVLSGELQTPYGTVHAGEAIEYRDGAVRIFAYDPSQAFSGYLMSWGPLPELPEIRSAQANPLFGPPDTHIYDLNELTQVNPQFHVPPVLKPEKIKVPKPEEEPPQPQHYP